MLFKLYGRGGIRTLDTVSRILVFKTNALNRSATSPNKEIFILKLYQIIKKYKIDLHLKF